MRTDKDLFAEESEMVSMSFGDHIEDLRYRLILGLHRPVRGDGDHASSRCPSWGRASGCTSSTPWKGPAQKTLEQFYVDQAARTVGRGQAEGRKLSPTVVNHIPVKDFVEQVGKIAPKLAPMLPDPNSDADQGADDRPAAHRRRGRPDPRSPDDHHPQRPGLARASGDHHDLLHDLHGLRPGPDQPVRLLPDLGVHRGRALSPRAALRQEVPAVLARPVPGGRVPLLLRGPALHPDVPPPVQRLARDRADDADHRLDELRDDLAGRLRRSRSRPRW